ncbi:MAG: glycosyltransferase family 2 protein, partial [Verrucomicrobia bacterium]|nr:glycosyltransferase family 2 protein [Verrucomicrobiota bacterium]
MKISALIHTRNEEANLADCLKSVAWADEVVVADMASTDRTRAIAQEHQARVLEVPVVPYVDLVRNQAVAACQGDWILVVDADERIPGELARRVRTLASANQAEVYALPRKNYFLGVWLEHGSWPDYQTRFFRKNAVQWTGLAHEPPRMKGRFEEFPADPQAALEHFGDGNDLPRLVQKFTRYSPLDAQRLAAQGHPPIWPFVLRRPLGEFYGRYITEQAWRHGMHGLVWSLLMAQYQLLVAAQYWAVHQAADPTVLSAAQLRRGVWWELWRCAIKWLRRNR